MTFHRFTLSSGDWGFVDDNGHPVLQVVGLGGGVIAIDVAERGWLQQLPEPTEIVARHGGWRLLYRGRFIA